MVFVIVIIHVIFSFSLKRFSFYKFCMTSFLFYISFSLKINFVSVFISVNDGQSISVLLVIVTVTVISLVWKSFAESCVLYCCLVVLLFFVWIF